MFGFCFGTMKMHRAGVAGPFTLPANVDRFSHCLAIEPGEMALIVLNEPWAPSG